MTLTVPHLSDRDALVGLDYSARKLCRVTMTLYPEIEQVRWIARYASQDRLTPMGVVLRSVLEWDLPGVPTGQVANQLVEALLPLLEKVMAGHKTVWNGHDREGRMTQEALEAERTIGEKIQEAAEGWDETNTYRYCDAQEWLQDPIPPDLTADQIYQSARDDLVILDQEQLEAVLQERRASRQDAKA